MLDIFLSPFLLLLRKLIQILGLDEDELLNRLYIVMCGKKIKSISIFGIFKKISW
jgi:hypothetical protein